MEKKELISVIIPVYNVEKYLHECVDSVLAQTYENFEVILVDDGSKDSSRDICEKYAEKDKRISLICQKNSGASAARNRGLKEAKGEYIYFLDSDDWLEKSALELLITVAEKSNSEITFFDAYSIDEETGKVTDRHYNHKFKYEAGKGYLLLKELVANKEFHVTPWSMFFKHSFLKKEELFFEEGIIYEDLIFAYKAFCLAEKVEYLPEFLYYRRYRENSVMTSKVKQKNFNSAVKVYREVSDFSEKLDSAVKCNEHIVRCAYNVLNVYDRLNADDKKECKNELISVKKEILSKDAHGDTSLKLRCYHKVLWAGYKAVLKALNITHIGVKK